MAAEIHVGDKGTVFEATMRDENGAIVNLSTATLLQIVFAKPDGSVVTKTAAMSTNGSDGKLRWTTSASSDLDQAGWWRRQAVVEFQSGVQHWSSDVTEFEVVANLA